MMYNIDTPMPKEVRCHEVEKNLYEFKEQYAINGREILRLAMSIESITKEVRSHHAFSEENKKIREEEEEVFREELKPLLKNYNAFLTGRKWMLGIVIFITAVGSLYLQIRNILNK